MTQGLEAELNSDAALHVFQFGREEFNRVAARGAHHVVMRTATLCRSSPTLGESSTRFWSEVDILRLIIGSGLWPKEPCYFEAGIFTKLYFALSMKRGAFALALSF